MLNQGLKTFVFRKIWHALYSCYLRFEIGPFAISPANIHILELASLCSQFPLTIELILPLITFAFFFYMHLCHSLDLFLCSFLLQFNVFCSSIWRDSFYLFYSTLYLFSVWIYKYVQIYNSNKQIAEAINQTTAKLITSQWVITKTSPTGCYDLCY